MKQLILCISFLILSSLCYADDASNDINRRYALTIAGGISLGAYESGVNWAIIRYFKKLYAKPERTIEVISESSPKKNSLKIRRFKPDMVSIAGASAGSINSFLSSLYWCSDPNVKNKLPEGIDDNLLSTTWRKIGFDTLLPLDSQKYLNKKGKCELGADFDSCVFDGFLSRKQMIEEIDGIKTKIAESSFLKKCKTQIGFTITSEAAEQIKIENFSLNVQRFSVIAELEIDSSGNPKFYQRIFSADEAEQQNIILIPPKDHTSFENKQTGARYEVDIDQIIRVLLISSAFPVAFGRIQMEFYHYLDQKSVKKSCNCNSNEDVNGEKASVKVSKCQNIIKSKDRCFIRKKKVFVDGGTFDNLPLGLTAFMAEQKNDGSKNKESKIKYEKNGHFIYINPSARRKPRLNDATGDVRLGIDSGSEDEEIKDYKTENQLGFIFDAVSTAMDQELYNTLRHKEWFNSRIPHQTLRLPPLTGETMFHFGAFIDKGFRVYDFYMGIYDGRYFISRHICESFVKKNESVVKKKDFEICTEAIEADFNAVLGIENINILNLTENIDSSGYRDGVFPIHINQKNEYLNVIADGLWKQELIKLKDNEELSNDLSVDAFKDFLEHLNNYHYLEDLNPELCQENSDRSCNPLLEYAVKEPDSWETPIIRRFSYRANKLHNSGGVNLMTMFAIKGNKKSVDNFTILDETDKSRIWAILLPYEVSVYPFGGTSISWEWRLPIKGPKYSFAFQFSPINAISNDIKKYYNSTDFISTAFLLNLHFWDSSSISIGPAWFYEPTSPVNEKKQNLGGQISYQAANIFRITGGMIARENDSANRFESFVRLGVIDFSGILLWVSGLGMN